MAAALTLALDLSTSIGWALGAPYETPRHGIWALGKHGDCGRYFSSLANQLEQAIQVMRPDLIIFEAPLPPAAPKSIRSSTHTVRVLVGLAAVTEMICYEAKVKCEEADVREARQLVLGKQPTRGKQTIVDWCRARGLEPGTDDAADALLLLQYRHILGRAKVMA